MYNNNQYTNLPNQFYPMTAPGFQYGQPQMPYVPAPMPQNTPQQTYQTTTTNQTPVTQSANQIHMGRTVSDPSEISAQDVSMDGSMTLFPKKDGSAIYGRAWQPNGGIAEVRFVPEQSNAQNNQQNDPFVLIMDELSDIKDEIDNLKTAMNKRHKPYQKNYRKNNQNGSAESESGEVNA